MKKISILLVIGLMTFYSCTEDVLEVQNTSLTADTWYQTSEDFQMAINSCYITMMGKGMHGRLYPLFFGVWGDRTLFETTGRDKLTTNSSDGEVEDVFDELYQGVYRTSKVLQQLYAKGVEGIDGMTQENFDYIAAQAKALRALYYFKLVTVFDKPFFYNEETIPEDLLEPLENADQITFWNQIEKDLTEAIPHLKVKTMDENLGRVTIGAANALLGKALLFKHYYYYARFGMGGSAEDLADLEQAGDAFKNVMESGVYRLVQPQAPKSYEDYTYSLLSNSAFKDLITPSGNTYVAENNEESVWEVQFGDQAAFQDNPWLPGYFGPGSLNMQFFSPHLTSYRNIEGHPALYYEFEEEGAPAGFDRDPRCYATFYFDGEVMDFDPSSDYYTGIVPGTNYKKIASARGLNVPFGTIGLPVKKHYFPVYWDGLSAPFNDPNNKRLIRYADVLLMYAEVMYLLGDDGTGLEALNEVRRRVDMPEISALSVDAIIHERDVELAFEYHRWFDLVRWSFDSEWATDWNDIDWGIDAVNSTNPFVVGKHEFLPIPLKEIDLSGGKLEQNPGW